MYASRVVKEIIVASVEVSGSSPMITSSCHFRHFNLNQGLYLSCLYLPQCFRHLSAVPLNSCSSTLLYLQSSCGLSLKCAAENIPNCTTENIDKILSFLRAHGLRNTEISSIISLKPSLLIADLEKTIKPNMEVFASLEISGPALVKMARKAPNVLQSRAKVVVEVMKEYNLTTKEISVIAKKCPSLFEVNLEKTLLPKLEYFKSSGFSDAEVRKLLSSKPQLLKYSQQHTIQPAMAVLREYLGGNANVVRAINSSFWVPKQNLRKTLHGNFQLLISHGVPSPSMTKIPSYSFPILLLSEERLKRGLKEVMKLGISPTNSQFMRALRVFVSLSKERREMKLNLYRSFGVSDEDITKLLSHEPLFLTVSEAKIKENLGFLINRLKMDPSFVGKYPRVLQLSMKKRILGRCAVMEILVKKGFIKSFKIGSSVCYSEKRFDKIIIDKYKNVAPEIVKAQRGLIAFNGFPDGFLLS